MSSEGNPPAQYLISSHASVVAGCHRRDFTAIAIYGGGMLHSNIADAV